MDCEQLQKRSFKKRKQAALEQLTGDTHNKEKWQLEKRLEEEPELLLKLEQKVAKGEWIELTDWMQGSSNPGVKQTSIIDLDWQLEIRSLRAFNSGVQQPAIKGHKLSSCGQSIINTRRPCVGAWFSHITDIT